jgi:hypothetical protein
MTPERWQQIDHLFHETRLVSLGCARAFWPLLARKTKRCGWKWNRLLSSHDGAEHFIETPAGDVAAELLGSRPSSFEPGLKIENYRIVRLLGTGGMGKFTSRMTRGLIAKSRLKLLPPALQPPTLSACAVLNGKRRAAFSLNHPNIVTIYEIGKVGLGTFHRHRVRRRQDAASIDQ